MISILNCFKVFQTKFTYKFVSCLSYFLRYIANFILPTLVIWELICSSVQGKKTNLKTGISREQSTPKFSKNKHFLPPDTHKTGVSMRCSEIFLNHELTRKPASLNNRVVYYFYQLMRIHLSNRNLFTCKL